MKKISILGIGLIGGSLALSLKKSGEVFVTGYDVDAASLERALSMQVIDRGSADLGNATTDADVIVLCAPVSYIPPLIEELAGLPLKPGCIITDTGSTKQKIVEFSARLADKSVHFIGGHPMAGSHKSGVDAASSILFENAYYILTPGEGVPESVVEDLTQLLTPTKAKILHLDAEKHDQVVGAISHFPHMIAAVLVQQVARYSEDNPLYQMLAAGGFRDITRIASSNPVMWRDILMQNRESLLQLCQDWDGVMQELICHLEQEDACEIERFFSEAQKFRNQLPERKKGAIMSIYDLYVNIPDHPGVIGKITTLLGEYHVNLSNIQIIESREDVYGALRLTFRNEVEMDRALTLLKGHGYNVYARD